MGIGTTPQVPSTMAQAVTTAPLYSGTFFDTAPPKQLPLPKVMLLGGVGGGKTHAIRTLLDAGLEVFCIFTEPGMETLSDTDPTRLHWKYIEPASPDWSSMHDSATKINTMSFKTLTEQSDINKKKFHGFLDIIDTLANFDDDRTGKRFGPVDLWGRDESHLAGAADELARVRATHPTGVDPNYITRLTEAAATYSAWKAAADKYGLTAENNYGRYRAVVLDSLSGLNTMAMSLAVGSKPVKNPGDWGVAMDNLEWLILRLTTSLNCMFVLTGHVEREADELTGGIQLMASTLGRKLAPRLPRNFSDVIHCIREGTAWFWSTATLNMDLKARNVPIQAKLPPSFVPLLQTWKSRQFTKGN